MNSKTEFKRVKIYENELLPINRHLSHDNIIKIFYTQLIDSDCWIILEYCDKTLHDLLETLPVVSNKRKSIIFQAVRGIEYLHLNKVAHRDVKPNNILIKNTPNWPWVKVTDFSFARDLSKDDTNLMSTVQGNCHWMAPELLDEHGNHATHLKYTLAVDIYSLGLVLGYISMDQNGREYLRKAICMYNVFVIIMLYNLYS